MSTEQLLTNTRGLHIHPSERIRRRVTLIMRHNNTRLGVYGFMPSPVNTAQLYRQMGTVWNSQRNAVRQLFKID